MSWNTTPVQQATHAYTNTTTTVTATLAGDPTVGNLLVAAYSTSSELAPVNDGWIFDATDGHLNDFTGLYVYYRVATEDDNLTALRTITRTLAVADRTAVWIAEFAGAGPWTSLTVKDKSAHNKPGGQANTISTGTTAALGQPDGLALAFFSIPRILGAGADTLGPYTNGFAEVAEVGTTGGDAPLLSVAVRDVGNSTAAVETTATIDFGAPPNLEHRPLGIVMVFKTDPPVTVNAHLSGGASNTSAAASIGGTESSHLAVDVLPDISRLLGDQGGVFYRLVYLHNEVNTRSLTAAVIATVDIDPVAGLAVAVGTATQASGVTVPAIANETTAPAGVTFTDTADLDVIGHNQARGLWVRLTVTALVDAVLDSAWHIDLDCEPL